MRDVALVMLRAVGWRQARHWMRRACRHVELDFARQLDDGFGMMAVLEQRVFDGLRAVDEQAAIETVLFLGDPVAAAVFANKDDGRLRAARWRFDELHVS